MRSRLRSGYDTSILAEAAQDGFIEIICSVLVRGEDVQVSVWDQPKTAGTMSYSDKYLSGAKAKGGGKAPAAGMKSAQRVIPAPIPEALTQRIQDAAMAAFRAIGAAGVTRVDFLVDTGERFIPHQRGEHRARLALVLSVGGVRHDLRQRCSTASWRWRWRDIVSVRQPRPRSTRGCSPVGRAERRPERGSEHGGGHE